jgi:hypothetical protein
MAGDWIKMRSNLHEDPRVIQIAALLPADELHVVGLLFRAWAWADGQSLDGNALSVTETFLDRIVRRDGFAAALRKVGWLEGRDNALTFPRFAEHNGQTAKSRAVTKDRVRKARSGTTVTDVTLAPLPEKRREEKRRSNTPKPPVTAQAPDPRHNEITQQWGPAYRSKFGYAYAFRAKDAATLKRFLGSCDEPSAAIMKTAAEAWDRVVGDRFAKHCKQAATIHGLCTYYNDIQVELQTPEFQTTSDKTIAGWNR